MTEALFSTLPVVDFTSGFQDMMSAHEAGHAALGIALGVRVEAVYALRSGSPNPVTGNIRYLYQTKFGVKAGVHLKDLVLFTAGGAAGEFILNGNWNQECVQVDRKQLENRSIWNFDYCVEQATERLRENHALLVAVRNKIRLSMSNFRRCRLARGGTHVILAKGSEIEKLFRVVGFSVSSALLDLEKARARATPSPLAQ